MALDEQSVDGDAHEQVLDSLILAYDEALAAGETPLASPATAIPRNVAHRLRKLQACVALLDDVGRSSWPAGTSDPLASISARQASVPDQIGRFEIIRELGRGGYGVVFLAFDPALQREVALKVPRPEALVTPELSQRFLREAQAAGSLAHRNLVAVYEVGEDGPLCYIASAYCDGPTVAQWLHCRADAVSVHQAAELVAALADGVEVAHGRGILHRDIKPSNVLLEPQPKEPDGSTSEVKFIPKLTDFGLARLQDNNGDWTRSGVLLGTPSYMAPEQAEGRLGDIGRATDVYGLGAILYEMLCSKRVFQGSSDADTLRRVVNDEPTNLRRWRPDVPRDLEAICLTCLQKQPDRRYPTAGALAADLRRFSHGLPTHARPLTPVQRLLKWTRRRPAIASLLAVCTVASLALLVMTTVYIKQLKSGRATAEALRSDAESSAKTARRQEQLASRFMYVSQMRSAYEGLEQGDIGRVEGMLDQYKPGSRLAHLRGFEWYHLERRLHGEALSLIGHRGEVYAVAFSPDGRVLASGGQDGTIRFWDPQRGQELATIAAHDSCVNAVVYSADGQILASASCDHMVKLWHGTTHELIATLEGHRDEVHCLAISSDGELLASGGHGPFIHVWHVPTQEIVRSWYGMAGEVNSLAWRPGSRQIVAGAATQRCFWDFDHDRQVAGIPGGAIALAISPTGSESALGQLSGVTILEEGFSKSIEELPTQSNGGPRSLAFSSDGAWLAAGAGNGTIRIWDRNRKSLSKTVSGHTGRVQSLVFAPGGEQLASASFDGTVKLWRPIQGEDLPTLQFDYFLLRRCRESAMLALSSDCRYVAWPSSLYEVKIFDSQNGVYLDLVTPTREPIRGLNFLAGEGPIVFGIPKDSAHLSICDVAQQAFEGRVPIPSDVAPGPGQVYGTAGSPREIVLSPDGRQVISTSPRLVTISDAQSGEAWFQHAVAENIVGPTCHFSPDARFVAISFDPEPACVADLVAKQLQRTELKGLRAISNEGRVVAATYTNLAVLLIELASGRELCTLRHGKRLCDTVFSPDTRTCATGTEDGCVHLWNVATGELITRFETRSGGISKLQFSPNGRKLAAFAESDGKDAPEGRQSTVRLFIWEGIDGS